MSATALKIPKSILRQWATFLCRFRLNYSWLQAFLRAVGCVIGQSKGKEAPGVERGEEEGEDGGRCAAPGVDGGR